MAEILNARDLPDELALLIADYAEACWTATAWLDRNTDYDARYWKKKMKTVGPLQASLDLIRAGKGNPQSGYLRLLEIGQVERSIEFAVLDPHWEQIFIYFPDVTGFARLILLRSDIDPPS
jgi:hypothetical protein